MTFEHINHGTCSRAVTLELDNDRRVHNVRFAGGCGGNTQGVARLVEGMDASDAIRRLKGIRCGMKPTSCPDQLAEAIEQALAEF